MKYMLLICDDETRMPSEEEMAAAPEFRAWLDKRGPEYREWLATRNPELFGARLRPSSSATTVRIRDGEVLVTDGPFAETKDLVGGIQIFECSDLDEAIEQAAAHPYAHWGTVEIRPIWE
jgi:hypothetical protein